MRRTAVLVSCLLGLSASAPAWGQSATAASIPLRLAGNLSPTGGADVSPFQAKADDLMSPAMAAPRVQDEAKAAATGFAFMTAPATTVDSAHPLRAAVFDKARGPINWSEGSMTRASAGGAVDTVRLSVASAPVGPGVRTAPGGPSDTAAYDVTITRGWPTAVTLDHGAYELAVSPHAGLGMSSNGGTTAEAGAMVQVSPGKKSVEERLGELGVKDGRKFGDKGRWYAFAAVSGRAVGLNMTQGDSGWNHSVSVDRTSALIGDGQVGVGWRRGPMQAAFGYVHREIKVQNAPHGSDNSVSDSMAAISLSIRPSW